MNLMNTDILFGLSFVRLKSNPVFVIIGRRMRMERNITSYTNTAKKMAAYDEEAKIYFCFYDVRSEILSS